MNDSDSTRSAVPSFIPLLLAFIFGGLLLATLSVLTLNFLGVVFAIFVLLGVFIAFQYLLWGWWLGPAIRRAEQEESGESSDLSP